MAINFQILNFFKLKNINIVRKFSLTEVFYTRTDWSKNRIRIHHPSCFIPRYLLNGSFNKGHGKSGRNCTGKITTRHKVGPGKKNYRMVDFMRVSHNEAMEASEIPIFKDEVVGLAYDPNRSTLVAKVIGNYSTRYRLILAASGLKVFLYQKF
ncbi:hypothetical protein MXB_981 [Myxobolus squamalis]|nr:hypothetical protein MXB_981 [Myxobolus squamalis]